MTETYSIAGDFSSGFNLSQLAQEILEDVTITTALTRIDRRADVVDIVFATALSGGEQTALNAVVAAHAAVQKSSTDNLTVICATTTAQTLATDFEEGDVIDGVTLKINDMVLVKDQADAKENGVYQTNASGAPTRDSEFDTDDAIAGASVFVIEGTVNQSTNWYCTNSEGGDLIGTHNIVFQKTSILLPSAGVDNTIPRWDGTNSFQTSGLTITDGDQLLVDNIDTLTATTLVLGVSTATKIEIADTGIITEVQGNLDALEGLDVTGNITVSGIVDGRDVAADGTQLDLNTVNIGEMASTGLIAGGVLSIGTPTTTFSVSDGSGTIIDNTTTPLAPTTLLVTWSGKTNVAVTNIATHLTTFVLMNSVGNIVQQTTVPTNAQTRDNIYLGVVVHVDKTVVNAIDIAPMIVISVGSQLRDLFTAIGFLNISGNVLTASGANLQLIKTTGEMLGFGANWQSEVKNPHVVIIPALDTATDVFQYRLQDGTNVNPSGPPYLVDPANYDLNGVLTTVPSNKFTIQHWYIFTSGNLIGQYGQNLYKSMADAKEAVLLETFVVEPSIAANGMLIGHIIIQEGTTSLVSTADVYFLSAGKFGASAGSSGGATLQSAYDSSPEPEILTNTLNDGIVIQRGSAADTDLLMVFRNGAGSDVMDIYANGNTSLTGLLSVDNIDALTASTLAIGQATTIRVEIADTGIVTEVQGNLDAKEGLDVTGNTTMTGTLTVDDVDTFSVTTLLLGKAVATKVEIADTAIITEIQGPTDLLEGLDVTGNTTMSGTLTVSDVDSNTATTLLIGKAVATKVEIGDTTIVTEVQGLLDVIEAATFQTTIAGNDIDSLTATTLLIGKATATKVEIADTTIVTEIQGLLDVAEAATFQTTLTVDDIDSNTATTLLIGKATATKVEIADTTITTEVQGLLDVAEAATFQTTAAVDDLDALTATTLLIGKATATKVEIADTGIITEVQGNLDALEGIDITGNQTIAGFIEFSDVAEPSYPGAGIGRLYKKTGDDGLFWKPDAAGDIIDLTGGVVATLPPSTYSTAQDTFNIFNSAGWISGGVITQSGVNFDVTTGSGAIRSTASNVGDLFFFDWPAATGLTIADGIEEFVVVDYNAGSPVLTTTTVFGSWNNFTAFLIGTVVREGSDLYIQDTRHITADAISLVNQFSSRTARFLRDEREGGLLLSETGTRNPTVSGGIIWSGLNNVTIAAVDTSVSDTMDTYYRDGGGGWTKTTSVTQWPNTQWDDGTGTLATVGNNQYSTLWFYITVQGDLLMLYGQSVESNLATIEDAPAPGGVPVRISSGGFLIGRYIYQESATTALAIETVFGTNFGTTGAINHGELGGLTSDDHTQYATLLGRTGGQTLQGGNQAGENLILESTANLVKGVVRVINPFEVYDIDTATAVTLVIGKSAATKLELADSGTITEIQGNLDALEGIDVTGNQTLSGYLQLADMTAPVNPSDNFGKLYKKTGDDGIFWLPDSAGPEVDLTQAGGASDHGALTGLGDDDHTQYPLLIGRSTGQTLIGGTAASEDLTLESTSNATKGDVIILDSLDARNYLQVTDIGAPANGADGTGRLYKKTGSTGLFWLADSAEVEINIAASGGVSDHGALNGLGDDDHTIYPLLLGRSTGQTLIGGTAASDNLVFESTSNATKGTVKIIDVLELSNSVNQGEMKFYEAPANGTNYLTLKVPAAITNTITFTWPDSDGDPNDALLTDGAGVMSWGSVAAGFLKTTSAAVDVESSAAPVTGDVLIATSATTATWQTSSAKVISYQIVANRVKVKKTTYDVFARFQWDQSRYSAYTNAVAVLYADVGAADRTLDIDIYDEIGAASLGSTTGISADGGVTFSFTPPTSDTIIQARCKYVVAGGDSVAPIINGLAFEFLDSSAIISGVGGYVLTSVSTNYTAIPSDYFISVDCSSNIVTITLPLISTLNQNKQIFVIMDVAGNSRLNNITIQPSGSDTIILETAYEIRNNHSTVSIISDLGTNWIIF